MDKEYLVLKVGKPGDETLICRTQVGYKLSKSEIRRIMSQFEGKLMNFCGHGKMKDECSMGYGV